MRIFYLSPILGTGTQQDPYRTKVSTYAGVSSSAAAIPSQPDGSPVYGWTIVAVESATETAALQTDAASDPSLVRVPTGKMTTLIQNLTAAQQNRLNAWLTNQGIAAKVNVQPATDTVRDVIRKIVVVLYTEVAQEWAVE